MIEQATEQVMVKATPARCYEVAKDFEHYPEWSRDVKRVEILEEDAEGRGTAVRFLAEAMGRTTSYVLRYDYSDAPDRLRWALLEGDIERRLDGEYAFASVDGSTEVTYRLALELQVAMPSFVRRRAEGRILGAAVQELKARAES